ncbi:MAG: 23S rRNA (uracil(1939)-C(5))-methyltransferase RlmD [Ruminococcaceae bacterium]|nr:23S rRNA (uracil(1939)-C(5))-methyltransferase RlmD [Oscillospiraceae bacterium]
MMLKKNEIYRAQVTGFTSEGLGVCRVEGCAVFVPNAAPEEVYDLRIVHVGKNAAHGKIINIITRSEQRVNRECPYAKLCGGCDFWHLTYEAECEIKRQRVLDALNRLGGQALQNINITGAKICKNYRNKAQYPVSTDGRAGFFKKGTHDVIEIDRCLILPEITDQAKAAVLSWAKQAKVKPYDEQSHTGLLRHIFVRTAAKTGQIMVCLVINGEDIPQKKRLIAELTKLKGMTCIAINQNMRKGNAVLGEVTKTIWGEDSIEDILCGLRFRISPRSFYQVNRDQAEILYEKAMEAAQLNGNETVLDLYCGTGTITLCLAKKAKNVIGVEVIDAAIENAKENAKRNGIENARFFCADAGQAAKQLAKENTKPDVIVVDPPRKGISADVIEAIAEMSPKKVVYVSCDPATLARDVKLLCEKGYNLTHAEAVDLFPRCSHIESIVCLSK